MRCFRIHLFVVCSLLFFININAQRRSSCTTPNGEIARCIPISSCPVLYEAVTTRNKQQLRFLKQSQCGYGRDPLVCCGSSDNYITNPLEFAYEDEPTGWGNSNRRTTVGLQNWDRDERPSWSNGRTNNNNNNNEWNNRRTTEDDWSSSNHNKRTTTQRTNSGEFGTSWNNERADNNNNNGWNNKRTTEDDWGSRNNNNNRRTTTQRTNSEESSGEREDDRSGWGTNDRSNTNSNRNNNNRRTSQGSNGKLPDRSSCGIQEVDRILDGQATGLREFPWMALLQYRKKSGNLVFSCGGTLISSRYVLTAAHCVRGQIITKIGPLVNVRLGEYNTETARDCSNQLGFEICNEKPIDAEIDKVIPHPDYTDNSTDRYHDIALIKLKREVPFSDFIKPICLPTSSEKSNIGEKLVVAGWGRTEYASNSPVKLKLWVPVAESSQCSRKFRSAGVTLGNKQLCAGGELGRDSCNGDSGGPLMATTKNDAAQWYIEGIVSFGAKCGSEGWPGIYTRVSEYLDWIKNNAN